MSVTKLIKLKRGNSGKKIYFEIRNSEGRVVAKSLRYTKFKDLDIAITTVLEAMGEANIKIRKKDNKFRWVMKGEENQTILKSAEEFDSKIFARLDIANFKLSMENLQIVEAQPEVEEI